ncbi:PAS domain S-box-containing protein [Haloarcula vallismortis]|uniref:Bacterio-opsin activator-like protein n=2 Tax=Haloarcula vallismortis TaxID=28442 RepID=M0J077_HALVA|nr:bacterio-opsin activator domain-containing protein [Haloarcula vallismortis]EMA01110.1 bacterio-opsin activator-like protein [Haloarcula vallismortis ATCC 29715]SDW15506.1 PAS domain S-box-containing protein [Haloarcula vallismortis]
MVPNVVDGHDIPTLYGPAIDTLPLMFAIVDASGVILSTNETWREFGRENGTELTPDTLGMNYLDVADMADDTTGQQAADGLRAVLAGEQPSFELEYPCHTVSAKRWFRLYAAPFSIDGATFASIAHIDITARKERESTLEAAYEVCTDSDRTFTEQLDALLELGCEALGSPFGTLSRVHGDEYVFEAVTAPTTADLEAGRTTSIEALPNCRHVVEHREPLAVRDVEADAPELADSEWGIANYIGAPVVVDGAVYGTFCFYGLEPRAAEYTQWDLTFVRLLSDWAGYELERQRYTEQRDALNIAFPDPSFIIDAEGRFLDCLTDPETMVTVDDTDTLVGQTLHELLPRDTADSLLATIRAALRTGSFQSVEYRLQTPGGKRWFEARVTPLESRKYDLDAAIFVAREITAHKDRQAELERQRDALRQAQRLNVLGREIAKALQDTQTREEIESAVCAHLTESDLYQAVWAGSRGSATQITLGAAAGIDTVTTEDISPGEHSLAIDAIDTGEVQVVADIADVSTQSDTGADRPLLTDCAAVAAVPLITGDTTYGVLMVYASTGATIGCRESDILADLGRLIALSIQRVHSQQSLQAATTVELTFLTPDSDDIFAGLSAMLDCSFTLERRVPTSSGRSLHYVRVSGVDTDRVCQALTEVPSVESCTVVEPAAENRAPLLEVALDGTSASPLDTLVDYGGAVQRAVAADGDLRFTAEMAPDIDVRAVVEAIQEIAPGTELQSKQYVDQPVSTAADFQTRVRDRLTPKQAAALKTAYARGYYDWPRGSAAEELAETLDISAPTVHYRLRKAHDAVIGALFDSATGPGKLD